MKSHDIRNCLVCSRSPSARKVWVEIKVTYGLGEDYDVTFREEGVG